MRAIREVTSATNIIAEAWRRFKASREAYFTQPSSGIVRVSQDNLRMTQSEAPSYWIHAEDLVAVLVGPFASRESAEAHIRFCEARGDAADMNVVTDEAARGMNLDRWTPEEDRAFDLDACLRRIQSTGRGQ